MTILLNLAPDVKRFLAVVKTIFSPSFLRYRLPKELEGKRLHKHGSFKKPISVPEKMIPLLIHIAPDSFGHLPNVEPLEDAIRSLVASWTEKIPQEPPSFTEVTIDIPRLFEPDIDENGKTLKTGRTYSLFPAFVKPYFHHINVSRDAAFLSYSFEKRSISKAAKLVGVSPKTFRRWLKVTEGCLDKLLAEIAREIFTHSPMLDFLRGIGSDLRSKLRGLFISVYIWAFRVLGLEDLYTDSSQIGLTGIINLFLQRSGIGSFI